MTRKISRSVAKIHLGQLEFFSLGNLDSKRDWGHARDYVEVEHTHTGHKTGHVFPDYLRPQHGICKEPPMILCQKRNRDGEKEGKQDEKATCCEATDCNLVSLNSPRCPRSFQAPIVIP